MSVVVSGKGSMISHIYDRSTGRLTVPGTLLLAGVCLLLLLPLVFFPFGPDNSLFYLAGKKIVEQGAIHYVDIVDVKPPPIYHFNALAILLFGDSAASPRILDLLLQLLALAGTFLLVRRIAGRDLEAIIAVILWPLCYLGLNNANTTQTESFLLLFLVPALYLYMVRKGTNRFFWIGLLCGLAALMKFTFGVILLPFLIADMIIDRASVGEHVRRTATAGAGAVAGLSLLPIYLSLFGAWEGFAQMRIWTSGYTGLQFSSIFEFLRDTLSKIPTNLADEYSLVMLIGTAVAIGIGFGVRKRESPANDANNTRDRFLFVTGLLFLALLFSVIIEAKWVYYQVSRLFAPGIILAAFGLVRIGELLAAVPNRRVHWVTLPLALFLILGLSPISRYVFHVRPALLFVTDGATAFDAYYEHAMFEDEWRMAEVNEIGDRLREELRDEDDLYISSGVASLLYLRADRLPETSVFHAGFVIADYAPPEWREEARRYVLDSVPRFVLLHRTDRMSKITGNQRTSVETFARMPKVRRLLIDDYSPVMLTPSFLLLERSVDLASSSFDALDSVDLDDHLRVVD